MKGCKWISSLIILSMLLFVPSCSHKDDKEESPEEAGYGYSCQFFDVPEKLGYKVYQTSILMDGEDYCIASAYRKTDVKSDAMEFITDIYTVNSKCEIIYTLELYGLQMPQAIYGNEYVYIGYDIDEMNASQQFGKENELKTTVVFLDKKTGNLTHTLEPDFQVANFVPLDDGYVLVGEHTIALYQNNILEKKIVTDNISLASSRFSFFQEQGHSYAVEERDGFETVYHEVNFETEKLTQIARQSEIGSADFYQGPYIFNNQGECRINLPTMEVQTLAKYNEINVRPPKKNFISNENVALDDKHFAIEYRYADGSAEVLLFSYDSSINYSKRETIVIGGFGSGGSVALDWAIYRFNTQQDEYRAVFEDYSSEFGWYTPEDAQNQTLRMMKYFNEGHAPDIFVGVDFDFGYMGRNNMLVDMRPYIEQDNTFSIEQFTPSIQNVLNADTSCYSIFSSYFLNGYCGMKDVWDTSDVSIFDLQKKAQECGAIPYHRMASDIVFEALVYNFQSLWSSYENRPDALHDDIHALLETTVDIGEIEYKPASTQREFLSGVTMLYPWTITGLDSYREYAVELGVRTCFIGFPSINGSVHMINPCDQVAISNATKHPDVCWEIIREMFSEETQQALADYGEFPVNDAILRKQCDGALQKLASKNEDKEWIIADFCEAVNEIDTVATYDWGVINIITDEVNSYYSQNRSIEQITDTLINRLNLYYEENYK